MLGCVVRFSIVWCTGRVFDFVRMDSVYALRALVVSTIISVVLAFALVGFLVRSVQGGVQLARWSTVGRSKMERHEQYVWMVGGEHMSWRRKTSLDGSLHFPIFHHGA